jgi:peptidoglycan/LPS O-acetylase OafA/YrhL
MSEERVKAGVPAPAGSDALISQAGELRSRRIESVRAVAALAVLVGHCWIIALAYTHTFDGLKGHVLSGGLLGVFLFFTLSGYLLFWPFVNQAFGTGKPVDLGRYALNRALRILPLYYVVVAVLYVVDPLGASPSDWWRFALFIENYSPRTIERLDSAMWSLPVELQFYALLPLIALAVAKISGGSLGRAAVVVGVLALASFGLRLHYVILNPPGVSPLNGAFSLPTLFFFFATGMFIALLRLAWERSPPAWLRGVLASPDAWLLASVPAWLLAFYEWKREPLIALGAFLVVGACVLAPGRGYLVRVFDRRPLAAIGVASYSLYLWHVPLLVHVGGVHFAFDSVGGHDLTPPQSFTWLFVRALPVCLAVAFASYALIESPFLRLRKRWS